MGNTSSLLELSGTGDNLDEKDYSNTKTKSELAVMVQDTKTLIGHNDRIVALAYIPKINQIVSSSLDKMLKFWDPETGENVKSFTCIGSEIHIIKLFRDNDFFITCSENELLFWEVRSLKIVHKHRQSEPMNHLCVLDENSFVVGEDDGTMKIFRLLGNDEKNEGVLFKITELPKKSGNCIKYIHKLIHSYESNDQEREIIGRRNGNKEKCSSIVTCGSKSDDTIRMFDTSTGSLVQNFIGHDDWVLAVSSFLQKVPDFINNIDNQRQKNKKSNHEKFREIIVSGGNDKTLILFDAISGSKLFRISLDFEVYQILVEKTNNYLVVSGLNNGFLNLFSLQITLEILSKSKNDDGDPKIGGNSSISLNCCKSVEKIHTKAIESLCWMSGKSVKSGKHVLVTGSCDNLIKIVYFDMEEYEIVDFV